MPTLKLTPEIINAAIVGFEQQKLRIDTQIAELRSMLPGATTQTAATSEVPTGKPKRRKMSAAGRARIAAAQRKRWLRPGKRLSQRQPRRNRSEN